MSRVFFSHSSRDSRQAMAVKAWLIEQEPGLADEIFLDLDPHTGIQPGEPWRQALQQANARCEAVVCLLSRHWEAFVIPPTPGLVALTIARSIGTRDPGWPVHKTVALGPLSGSVGFLRRLRLLDRPLPTPA